jgi:small subunit ribosomal protein S14
MAKKSMIAKAKRTPKFHVRGYHRCFVLRFALCRISSRPPPPQGELPGVTKSSW